MDEYDILVKKVEAAGFEVKWYGAVDPLQIERLELITSISLPNSFKDFLGTYGGGGIISADVSGIARNNAEIDSGGTVFGDTMTCRAGYDLPAHLAVIYFHQDEICWCLDTSSFVNGECPVVSFDIFGRRIDSLIASDFSSFMVRHLTLYGEP
ncbi:SMI1/KNR4 family protein [Bordetella sp. LUAb4]|uniref:SMI1/KNR4 family protein n=1 Tax=Bordetella sp. LUAb4 TaxID=2843195 RepID=UPI001E339E75|nr:SMI1/KNR4 family protein [Bordetella sp. LUAb4]